MRGDTLHGMAIQDYLILFDPHAFAIDRQQSASTLPSLLVFRAISVDFTPTLHVPCASHPLKPYRFRRGHGVKPHDLTSD